MYVCILLHMYVYGSIIEPMLKDGQQLNNFVGETVLRLNVFGKWKANWLTNSVGSFSIILNINLNWKYVDLFILYELFLKS